MLSSHSAPRLKPTPWWTALILAGLIGFGHPAMSQDGEFDPCYHLDDYTSFCGKPHGWKPAPGAKTPGFTSFLNQEFALSIAHQVAHGRTPSSGLFAEVADGLLLTLDRRTGAPEGAHRADFVEVISHRHIEGRRMVVVSDYGEPPVTLMIDILISRKHMWIFQTGHAGPIAIERLNRAHNSIWSDMRLTF